MPLPWLKRSHSAGSLAVLVALLAAPLGVSLASAAPPHPESRAVGTPVTGALGASWTTADIMREEARHAGEPIEPALIPDHEFDKGDALPNPASPRLAS